MLYSQDLRLTHGADINNLSAMQDQQYEQLEQRDQNLKRQISQIKKKVKLKRKISIVHQAQLEKDKIRQQINKIDSQTQYQLIINDNNLRQLQSLDELVVVSQTERKQKHIWFPSRFYEAQNAKNKSNKDILNLQQEIKHLQDRLAIEVNRSQQMRQKYQVLDSETKLKEWQERNNLETLRRQNQQIRSEKKKIYSECCEIVQQIKQVKVHTEINHKRNQIAESQKLNQKNRKKQMENIIVEKQQITLKCLKLAVQVTELNNQNEQIKRGKYSQMIEFQKCLAERQQQMKQLLTQNQEIRQLKERMFADLQKSASKVIELKNINEEKRLQNERMSMTLSRTESQLRQILTQNQEIRKLNERIFADLQKSAVEVIQLKNQNQKIMLEKEQYDVSRSKILSQISFLIKQNQCLKLLKEEVFANFQNSLSQVTKLKDQRNERQVQKENILTNLYKNENSLRQLQSQKQQTKLLNERIFADFEKCLSQLNQLKHDYSKINDFNKELRVSIHQKQAQVRQLIIQNDVIKLQRQKISVNLERSYSQIRELITQKQQLESANAIIFADIQKLVSQVTELKNQNKQIKKSKDSQIIEFQKCLAERQQQMRQLLTQDQQIRQLNEGMFADLQMSAFEVIKLKNINEEKRLQNEKISFNIENMQVQMRQLLMNKQQIRLLNESMFVNLQDSVSEIMFLKNQNEKNLLQKERMSVTLSNTESQIKQSIAINEDTILKKQQAAAQLQNRAAEIMRLKNQNEQLRGENQNLKLNISKIQSKTMQLVIAHQEWLSIENKQSNSVDLSQLVSLQQQIQILRKEKLTFELLLQASFPKQFSQNSLPIPLVKQQQSTLLIEPILENPLLINHSNALQRSTQDTIKAFNGLSLPVHKGFEHLSISQQYSYFVAPYSVPLPIFDVGEQLHQSLPNVKDNSSNNDNLDTLQEYPKEKTSLLLAESLSDAISEAEKQDIIEELHSQRNDSMGSSHSNDNNSLSNSSKVNSTQSLPTQTIADSNRQTRAHKLALKLKRKK